MSAHLQIRLKALHELRGILSAAHKQMGDQSAPLIKSLEVFSDEYARYLDNFLPYINFPVPLYFSDPGLPPTFKAERGRCSSPAFIISIPKSGTYLVAAILERLGLVSSGIHTWEEGFHDYRNRTIQEMIERYREFAVVCPFDRSARLIAPGQFAVGHLKHLPENRRILERFRTFFCHRELRVSCISYMRWMTHAGRGDYGDTSWKELPHGPKKMSVFLRRFGPQFMVWCRTVSGWKDDGAPLVVPFETIHGDAGREAQVELVRRIAAHLDFTLDEKWAAAIIDKVLGAPTKTWSGKRSALEEYWDESCEETFIALGGVKANQVLGYDLESGDTSVKVALPHEQSHRLAS